MVAKPPEYLLNVQFTSVECEWNASEMWVEWGVWGVVDCGLGVVVGLMGEWWLVVCLWCRCGVGRLRHVFVCLSWWCGLSLLVAWGELLP